MSRPLGLLEFIETFGDDESCRQHIRTVRWGQDGFICPRCAEQRHWGHIRSRDLYQCNGCGYQSSITSGTLLQDTKLDLHKWFLGAYLVHTTRHGIKAPDLARKLGIRPEAARNMIKKLEGALATSEGRALFGLEVPDRPIGQGRSPGRISAISENPGVEHEVGPTFPRLSWDRNRPRA